ncbi:MAG: hypothetical protein IJ751_02425 [Oscillospiraceae bacterium]|nr:hypothetical protein [Oscillospiraceae bacterium]
MIDFDGLFEEFCAEHDLDIVFSDNMPAGYETANGTFDVTQRTLFLNRVQIAAFPEYEQLFYFFHELRHALQYLHPERFDAEIQRSRYYSVMYDGTCYVLSDGEWRECQLTGGEETFTALYLGQPYEVDANTYAYEKVRARCGDSEGLRELASFWIPQCPPAFSEYRRLYAELDRRVGSACPESRDGAI